MVTKSFKVYGAEGHRQRESFAPSAIYDWSKENDIRIVEIQNADITGTHEFSRLIITRNTEQEVIAELNGQISDGIFENNRVGNIVEEQEEEVTNLTYKEALELNELAEGLDMSILAINDLLNCIEELPGWDYPLAEDLMAELAKRAGIDPETFFSEHDTDYNGLYQACVEALGIDE